MQIQSLDTNQLMASGAKPLAIGQIHTISIKERLSDVEAIVSLGGKDTKMTFENGVPTERRVQIDITGMEKENVIAKQASKGTDPLPSGTDDLDALLKSAGNKALDKDVQQAAQMLKNKGYSLTNESVHTLQRFVKSEAGTIEQKLKTIEAAASRGLELSPSQLKAIHAALHGESLSRITGDLVTELPELAKALSGSRSEMTAITRLIEAVESSGDEAAVRTHVMEFLKEAQLSVNDKAMILKALPEEKESILKTLLSVENKGGGQTVLTPEAEQMRSLLKIIQGQPSIDEVFLQVKQFMNTSAIQDLQRFSDFMASVVKAEELSVKGRELLARKELTGAVAQLEERNPQLKQMSGGLALSADETSYIEQAVQGWKPDSKAILVTQISERLAQLTIDFKQAKRLIERNLEQSMQLLTNRQPQVKQLLESTIKQLDSMILKGDYMLYADMATEKKLLMASSRLQEAKTLLMSGNLSGASDMVREVKAAVEGLQFKPSDVKVKYFTTGSEDQQALYYKPEQSGRQMLEHLRRLGMMNETDTARTLIEGKQQEVQANLKSTLLQALNDGKISPKLASQAEQVVQTITGQQLLAKSDSSTLQQLTFQVPLLLQNHVEDVKVFVNGHSGKEAIDWENCSLYFLMATKRLGEIGISLTAQNRHLFIVFSSDKVDLANRLKPLAEKALELLGEIGYTVGSVQVKPFKREAEVAENESRQRQPVSNPFAGKGYDTTI